MERGRSAVAGDCPICAKHRGEGPLAGELVGRREGLWVYHAPPGDDGLAPLGYLLIETDRHVPYLADLSAGEAASVARLRTRLARALRDALDVEFVFAAVIGTGVAHFHEHLLPRRSREPRDVEWQRSADLLERADPEAVRRLATDLRSRVRLDA